MPLPPLLFDDSFVAKQCLRGRGQTLLEQHPLYLEAQARLHERLADITQPFKNICDWTTGHDKRSLGSFDLITSCLSLQHENDMAASFTAIYDSLDKGGLFLAVLIGGQSLHELRTCLLEAEILISGGASPRVAPMVEKEDAGTLLMQTGFALPVLDHEQATLVYNDLWELMQDLRSTGCANALTSRTRHFTSKRLFETANELYVERFPAQDGGITATFDLLFLHGWKE